MRRKQNRNLFSPFKIILGYADSYIVQAPTKKPERNQHRPDYAYSRIQTQKIRRINNKKNNYINCIGIADAKILGT